MWTRLQDEERDRITYRGWDTSKEFLERVVKEQGPFDGVMGFSQVQHLSVHCTSKYIT